MEPIFYMEYKESKKVMEEMFQAYYKYKNLKTWKPFRVQDVKLKAEEKANERYKEIKSKNRSKADRTIKVEFFEEDFKCATGDIIQEYKYDEIEGIYETDTTLVFVAGKNRKKDAFLGLKKGGVKGTGLAELKSFVLPRCTKIKNGVQFI